MAANKKTASKDNELDILLPESHIVINGEKIEIKPFLFPELPAIIKIFAKLGSSVFGMLQSDGLQFGENDNLLITPELLENVAEMVENNFPEIVEIISIYTRKPVEFYLDEKTGFNGEDGIILIAKIIERNYSFFTKRLASAIAEIKAKQK